MKGFPSFGSERLKRELQEELDAHLQMAIADRVEGGETAETARQAAAREFGNAPLVQGNAPEPRDRDSRTVIGGNSLLRLSSRSTLNPYCKGEMQ